MSVLFDLDFMIDFICVSFGDDDGWIGIYGFDDHLF